LQIWQSIEADCGKLLSHWLQLSVASAFALGR